MSIIIKNLKQVRTMLKKLFNILSNMIQWSKKYHCFHALAISNFFFIAHLFWFLTLYCLIAMIPVKCVSNMFGEEVLAFLLFILILIILQFLFIFMSLILQIIIYSSYLDFVMDFFNHLFQFIYQHGVINLVLKKEELLC